MASSNIKLTHYLVDTNVLLNGTLAEAVQSHNLGQGGVPVGAALLTVNNGASLRGRGEIA